MTKFWGQQLSSQDMMTEYSSSHTAKLLFILRFLIMAGGLKETSFNNTDFYPSYSPTVYSYLQLSYTILVLKKIRAFIQAYLSSLLTWEQYDLCLIAEQKEKASLRQLVSEVRRLQRKNQISSQLQMEIQAKPSLPAPSTILCINSKTPSSSNII